MTDQKTCPQCGAACGNSSFFCSCCGARIVKETVLVCPKCGENVPRGRFCMNCGYMITYYCKGCGKELNGNERFCPSCGVLTNPHLTQKEEADFPSSRNIRQPRD